MDWELGISRYKLLYIKWINNGSYRIAGNYIQYPVMKHNGKEKKKDTHDCKIHPKVENVKMRRKKET